VTTAAIEEAVAADVTVATATSANLSTAEAGAADIPLPVDAVALSSAGKAIAEAAAADVSLKTVASKTGRHWIGGNRGEINVGNQNEAQCIMRCFLVICKADKSFLHSTRMS
jgi:hypothetical protein